VLLDRIEQVCRRAVENVYGVSPSRVTLDFPDQFGDLALNAFHLAKDLRKAPPAIAQALAEELEKDALIEQATAVKGYVNLILHRPALAEGALSPALQAPDSFGFRERTDGAQRIMVEFSSPNTNKPQHLGHVRTNCLGDSVARLLEATGTDVIRANLVNDRGIHIAKSMLAYQREGRGRTPESAGKKGDHFVGDFYVLFETRFREEWKRYKDENPDQSEISREDFAKVSEWMGGARRILQLWEEGDEEVLALWRRMNSWVMEGFEETYRTLGIQFDRIYLESETYQLGKEIVNDGLRKGVFYRRDDGAVEIDLTDVKLDRKVVLRSDGTSVYITQDIGTTVMKTEEYGLNGQIFVVGNEQIYHFNVLFEILKRLGKEWASNCRHLAYGMVNLPEGKMKSREGTVVDADNLIEEVSQLALQEIRSRQPDVDKEAAEERALNIALAALKFMILSVSPKTTMLFDPKASVSFEGDTGPYILYAYARIQRMLEDSGLTADDIEFDPTRLTDESEIRLMLKLVEFPRVVEKAAADLNPSLISNWLLACARSYHSHNRAVPILKADDPAVRKARLMLSRATATALSQGLGLLGIKTVDRM